MAVIQGKMFLLVHVDRHRDQMGEICNRLVADYGVPVSICDDIQKICPRCLNSPGAKSGNDTVSTTTVNHTSDTPADDFLRTLDIQHRTLPKVFPNNTPKVFPQSTPKPVIVPQKPTIPVKPSMAPPQRPGPILAKVLPLPPKNMPVPNRITPNQSSKVVISPPAKFNTNGSYHSPQPSNQPQKQQQQITQMVVVKRKESPVLPVNQEVKKQRIDLPVKQSPEELLLEDDDMEDQEALLGTVLKALQNGGAELHFNGSGASSDDGASNSSNIYDTEDDDKWNPDFLTNFITSQPDIFSATTQESTRAQSKEAQQTNGKRLVPPMLTVNGKTRRGRIVYTSHELNILEKYYEEDPNACADPKKRETMCKTLSIDYHRLKVWFQNRRRKDKVKSQEDPTLSFNGLDGFDGMDYSPEP